MEKLILCAYFAIFLGCVFNTALNIHEASAFSGWLVASIGYSGLMIDKFVKVIIKDIK